MELEKTTTMDSLHSTQIINYTPHTIKIIGVGEIPSSGAVRCSQAKTKIREIEVQGQMVPVFKTEYGEAEGLPEPQSNTLYVVSAIVAQALKGTRSDLIISDKVRRDRDGNILGCEAFGIIE